MPETREGLLEAFSYDLWANREWSEIIPKLGERGQGVWEHLLFCHTIWYGRVISVEETPELPGDVLGGLEIMTQAWIEVIQTSDPTAFVSYQRGEETHFQLVEDVLRHVANHGTYHRGQLREIAEQAGVEWPETDYMLWKRLEMPGILG